MTERRHQTRFAQLKPEKKVVDTERNEGFIESARREIRLNEAEIRKHEKVLNNLIRLWKNNMSENKRDKLYELQSYISFYEKDTENYKKLIKRLK